MRTEELYAEDARETYIPEFPHTPSRYATAPACLAIVNNQNQSFANETQIEQLNP